MIVRNLFFVILILFTACKTQDSDWISLFDGKSLDGWEIKIAGYDLNDNHNNTYVVEDKSIVVSYDSYDTFDQKDGNIFYTKNCSEFSKDISSRGEESSFRNKRQRTDIIIKS